MAEFKISGNKFAMLFKEFPPAAPFSQYIQNCRLDYAVKLMRENPQWNFDAIAKEAQMSNGAFYNHFKTQVWHESFRFQNRGSVHFIAKTKRVKDIVVLNKGDPHRIDTPRKRG